MAAVLSMIAWPALALADMAQVRVTVENLAPANSVTFAPLHVGFHGGTYDAFNSGAPASPAIVSVAEGGSGSAWFPAFAAADPTATLGTVLPNPPGPLLPGMTASAVFTVDTAINRYFTFASMVVPSNDVFIGNDSPTAYMLFDDLGNLNLTSITQRGEDIWDAGSEVTEAANAAFLVVGSNDPRTEQNGVVSFDFSGITAFDGLTTAAGYVLDSQLAAELEVYRISFSLVPEPSAIVLGTFGCLALGSIAYRRRKS
jgi:hypothetical protein